MAFRCLKPEEVEVRVGRCSEKGVSLLLYKTARTDANLLDETYGPERWQCDYKDIDGKLYCGIGVLFDGIWVWKWDTGTESNMEAQKGEASDAFKRAGFKWGIGRELYTAPRIWVGPDKCRVVDGRNGKKQCFDDFRVTDMSVANGGIAKLTVCNMSRRGTVVYGNAASEPQDVETAPHVALRGRYGRISELKDECLGLGIREDGIRSWLEASFGGISFDELDDRQLNAVERHLETLLRDKRELMGLG